MVMSNSLESFHVDFTSSGQIHDLTWTQIRKEVSLERAMCSQRNADLIEALIKSQEEARYWGEIQYHLAQMDNW